MFALSLVSTDNQKIKMGVHWNGRYSSSFGTYYSVAGTDSAANREVSGLDHSWHMWTLVGMQFMHNASTADRLHLKYTMYKDGVNQCSGDGCPWWLLWGLSDADVRTFSKLILGSSYTSTGSFAGLMSDVGLYNVALNAADVARLYVQEGGLP
jgi:hypothetical protein